jgi:dTDP-4-amino-4,6-dideoxygalactose transaminase
VDKYLCLEPRSVVRRINYRTKAVIFMGMGGNVGQLAEIKLICKRYALKLILDGAHMSGTWQRERHVGFDTDAAIFSFQSVKNLPTADGGMLCWPNDYMDTWSRRLSWMGIDKSTYERSIETRYSWEYRVNELGYKYHGNSIMAAMGLVGLRHLEEDNARRRAIAVQYDDAFANSPGVRPIPSAPTGISSRHLYQILVGNRDKFVALMQEAGINVGVHYISNWVYPLYHKYRYDCSRADYASEHVVSLPMHLHLTQADIDRIIEAVKLNGELSDDK